MVGFNLLLECQKLDKVFVVMSYRDSQGGHDPLFRRQECTKPGKEQASLLQAGKR